MPYSTNISCRPASILSIVLWSGKCGRGWRSLVYGDGVNEEEVDAQNIHRLSGVVMSSRVLRV